MVEVGCELDCMRERTGGALLAERRLDAEEQVGRSGYERRTKRGTGSRRVRATGESADDVFTRGGDPDVGVAIIGEG